MTRKRRLLSQCTALNKNMNKKDAQLLAEAYEQKVKGPQFLLPQQIKALKPGQKLILHFTGDGVADHESAAFVKSLAGGEIVVKAGEDDEEAQLAPARFKNKLGLNQQTLWNDVDDSSTFIQISRVPLQLTPEEASRFLAIENMGVNPAAHGRKHFAWPPQTADDVYHCFNWAQGMDEGMEEALEVEAKHFLKNLKKFTDDLRTRDNIVVIKK